uniref:Uncharacterized protein n=1 Tax=Cacopsylla melanoneura TaxID=428564 RepID=A0A8D8ZB62_9HEMI
MMGGREKETGKLLIIIVWENYFLCEQYLSNLRAGDVFYVQGDSEISSTVLYSGRIRNKHTLMYIYEYSDTMIQKKLAQGNLSQYRCCSRIYIVEILYQVQA